MNNTNNNIHEDYTKFNRMFLWANRRRIIKVLGGSNIVLFIRATLKPCDDMN